VMARVIQPKPAADWNCSLVLRDQTGSLMRPEDVVAMRIWVGLPRPDRR
jgi:hypothetical protein